MCCPSFRSTAVRQIATPFTLFSSISCVMTDTFWRMASFCAASDLSTLLTSRIFTAKVTGRQIGRSWRPYVIKISNDNAILSNVKRSRSCLGRVIWGSAPSCIKATVWSACYSWSSGIMLIYNSAAYRWSVTETVSKPIFATPSGKNGPIMKSVVKLEFFCVPFYTEFLSDLSAKFQVASTHDINVEYQIWSFAVICFWAVLITDTHRHTHIHTDQTLKMWFSDSGDLKTCKSIKISISKIWPKNNTFSTYR